MQADFCVDLLLISAFVSKSQHRMQLIFRTMNRDMQQANTNEDDIAFLFRNRLMPVRSDACICTIYLGAPYYPTSTNVLDMCAAEAP